MNKIKQVICVRKDLNMRKGKLAAQVGHASMAFMLRNYQINEDVGCPQEYFFGTKLTHVECNWLCKSFTKIVVSVDSQAELEALIAKAEAADVKVCPVVDNGLTEFHGVPTLTCAAFGPDYSDNLDPITGHLKPL